MLMLELDLKMAYTAHIGIQILIPAKDQYFSFVFCWSIIELRAALSHSRPYS